MDVLEAVLTRRSATRLVPPAPDDAALLELIQAASAAPDHGLLRPWRLVLVRDAQRELLGAALAEAATDAAAAERARAKPLRAPLLVSIVFCPRPDHPKVPVWEQLAATVSVVQNLHLLLHSRGWGAIWRTGRAVDAPAVRHCVGVGAGEQLLGWLYVGTPGSGPGGAPRSGFDARTKVRTLGAAA
ncbi:nitroreductase [Streptomyces sp. SCA3-4]|uniref:nitroreductase family protein n=1 Tax=Streptomyces sichuanensis TaxID=2871810 RepID=UPI001CE2C8BE|nr:nitroreductase [Streptomyces sichuanensis]MCA6096633.1 nitroreductase [Streptomyces sichuanensis]